MRIDLITLFPEMCKNVLDESIIGRAQKSKAIEIYYHQLRQYAYDKHRRVDDTPYGGGMGMLMLPEPIALCIENIQKQTTNKPHVVYMSPKGKVLNQNKLKKLSEKENICVLCGHYEGIDQRVIDEFVDEEISIGDYVLTGGELPALVFIDSLARLVPNVLSNEECYTDDSHYNGLLEYPQYTRPNDWRGKEVPSVLLSGHHKNIEDWRRDQSIIATAKNRPDLIKKAKLTEKERKKADLIIKNKE